MGSNLTTLECLSNNSWSCDIVIVNTCFNSGRFSINIVSKFCCQTGFKSQLGPYHKPVVHKFLNFWISVKILIQRKLQNKIIW